MNGSEKVLTNVPVTHIKLKIRSFIYDDAIILLLYPRNFAVVISSTYNFEIGRYFNSLY